MYLLMCEMQSQKIRNLDNILTNLSLQERNTLMERLQRDGSGEEKRSQYELFLQI